MNARVVADIDFSEYSNQGVMIGTKTTSSNFNSYQGVFDGGGYKITLNYDVTEQRVGLFQYVGTNCNIKNVYTTGSINTTSTEAAGVVAYVLGNTSNVIIENCYSDVNIYQNNSTETNAYQGGIVGYVYNSDGIIIRNCGFTGTLNASNATKYYGGVVGYVNNNKTTVIENCYFAGTAPKATGSPKGAIYTYNTNKPQLKNCCYNSDNAFDTTQGTGFTSKQFRNGNVWEFLSNADEITLWRQSLDADAVPYPFETGGHKEIQAALYYNIENFEVGRAYSNTHTFEKPNASNSDLPEYVRKFATAYKTENGEEIFADSDSTYTSIKDRTVVYISLSAEGNGTKEAPYEIDNADKLALFAELVNTGCTSICGKVVADIDFSEHSNQGVMIGTQIGYDSFNSYQGVFDGGGYKITLNYNVTESRVGLFQYVGTNCNIKNVYTTGSINTTETVAAGVVAYALGNTSNIIIENCYSDVNIYQNNSTADNAYQGGIVGYVYNSDGIIIRNCGFTGTLNASNATKYYGGVVGYVNNNKTTVIENCYFAGTAPKATGSSKGAIYSYYSSGKEPQLKNCCYNSDNAFDTTQGTGFTSEQFRNGEAWDFLSNDNEETPWRQNLNADATPFPFATGGHKTVYCLRFNLGNILLYEERSNDRTFKKPDNSVFPPYIKDMPLKYATEQGTEVFSDNTYTVSEDSIYNEVYLRFASVNGNGTKEAPYEIDNADKLALFAELVNIGCTSICGKVVADIDFSEHSNQGVMIGTQIGYDSFNSYQGVFDGGGYKITLDYDVTSIRVGLFQYVGTNCNIKNVYTTGSINTTETVAAGVVAYALGNTSNIIIENCYSDVSIYNNNPTADNAYQGGIVGYVYNSGIIIRNCGFTGTLDAVNATDCYGGVVGYVNNNKTTVIENCYFAGTAPKATGSSKGAIYSYYSSGKEPQLKNCCYNSDNAFDTTQGTGFTSEQFRNGEAWDFLSNDNEETPWRQNLNADATPFPFATGGHKTVYCLRFNLGKTSLYREFSNGVTFEKPDNSVFPSIISGNPLKYETEQGAEVFSDGNILYTVSGDSVYNDLYLKLSLWDSMGTIDDPYEIDNADKLALFAELVNGGCTGICGKVIADIDFSEYSNQGVMIGTELEDGSYNSYKGTFDGGGYKITLNYDVTEQRVGLFQYAGTNCNIKNVYTTGSINTTSTEAAGVVAYVLGDTSNIIIENCYSDVSIYQDNSAETNAYQGGIVGYVYNSDGIIIRNCGFTGTLDAVNATDCYGGVVGYVNNNKTTVIENCYFAGTAPKATGTPRGAIYTYNTNPAQINNCCYNSDNALSTAAATGFTSEQFTNGDVWDFLSNDNEETPWRQSLNDDTVPFPFATGGHKTVYCLRFNLGNILLYEERSNDMTFEKPDNSVFPSYISDKPLKYATEQGTEIFSGGDTYTVSGDSVYNDVYLKLSSWDNLGTIDDPYEIDNADKLAMFAELVNNGATEICGKVIADIDFSEYSNQGVMIGTEDGYKGTFDGGGYKITLNYNVTKQRVGLFKYVGTNCNIKNVYTTGKINTTEITAAGVVAYVLGDTSNIIIENCYSDVNIYQNNSTADNAYQGGIVGYVYNSDGIIIRNCGFTGTLDAAHATQYYGGVVGYVYNSKTTVIESCYFAGTAPKATGTPRGSMCTYSSSGKEPQLKNCCYNSDNAFDTAQGTGFTSEQFRNGEVWDFLSNADETTLWRQSLDADEVPYPYETGGHEKVAAVTFITESGSTKQYANYGDDITLPPLSSGDNQSAGWYIKDEDGNYSPFENPVKGNTTLYAESRIMYGGENDNIEINITYGDEKTVDLSRYVEYANFVDTKDKFEYKITNGNDVLRAVIEGDTLSIPANIDVGTYTLEITATEKTPEIMPIFVNSYGFEPVTFDISVKITEAPSSVKTSPAAKDLTYTGESLELVTAGEAEGGEMQYSLDGETYSSDVPKGTNADVYTVWYKVKGDSNHNDSTPQSVDVTIKKADSILTVDGGEVTYGDTITLTADVKRNAASGIRLATTGIDKVEFYIGETSVGLGTVTYDSLFNDSGTAKIEIKADKRFEIGANTIRAEYGGSINLNNSEKDEITVTMKQKPLNYEVSADGKVYDKNTSVNVMLTPTNNGEDDVTLTAKGAVSSADVGSYSKVDLTEIKADGADAKYYSVETEKNEVNLTGDIEITKAPSNVTSAPAAKDLTYDGTAQELVTAGETADGTMQYSLDNDTYSPDIPKGTEADTYTVWYKVAGDSNHNDSEPQSVEVTLKKATPSATVTPKDLKYTGGAQELVTGETSDGTLKYATDEAGEYTDAVPTGTEAKDYEVWYKVVGDGNHNDSTPQKVDVTIKKANSTLAVDGGEVTYGDTITLTAAVTGDNTNGIRLAAADIDKVEFFLNGTSLGTANVTYSSLFDDEGTATFEITANKRFEIGANTIRAEYGGSVNLNGSENNSITVTMKQKPLTYDVTADGKVYDENTSVNVTLTPTNNGEDNVTLTAKGTVSSADVGSYSKVDLTEIALDGEDAKYYSVETEKSGADLTAEIEITKAPSSVKTSPAANALTYTGEPLELVTAGEAEGGEMQYSTDGESYSPDVPTGTNANTYTVWYKVKGDSNHKDTEPQSVNVTIKKANSTLAVDGGDVTYGDAITLTATVTRDNTSGIRLAAVDLDKVEFFLDETSLGTANVTYGSLFNDSGTATLTITADKKFEIGANTIRAEYGGSVNLNGNENNSITVTMKQKPLNYEVSADGKVYDENTTVNVTLMPTNKVGEDSVTLTAKGTVSSADVGRYNKVDLTEIKVDGDDAKYYSVETEKNEVNLTGDVEITKAPSSVTSAPVEKTDLTYTGEPLELVMAGEAEGGEMQYSLDGESYSPVLPKGTNADTYTVWYKVVGDNNHSDSTPQSVEVTIKKAASTATVTPKDLTYTGEAQELVTGETTDGTLQYSTTETGIYSPDVPKGTNANTYTVWYQVVGDSNHNDSETQSVDVTIKKAAPTATVKANDLHYIGVAQELVTGEVVGGTLQYSKSEDGDYSPDIPTEIEVGTYTIWYKVVGDDNHTDLAPQSIQTEIKKAASVTDVTDKEVTYKDVLTLTATVSKKPFNEISLTALEDKVNFYLGETLLGSADVSYTNTELKDSGTATLEITADKRFAVGENTIRAEYGGSIDLAGSKNDNVVVTLNKKPIEYTVSAVGKTYDSNASVNVTLTPTNNGEDDVTLTAKGAVVTLTTKGEVSSANAGSYGKVDLTEIAIDGDDAEYYSVDTEKSGVDLTSAVEITKAPSNVKTSPAANALTYTGEPLELVTAGEATGGTMQYSLDGETYSPDIPKGTNADTYMVWYKVVGDNNHNDSEPQSIDGTIKKAASSATVLANDLTYTGDAQELVTGEATGGTLQYSKSEDGDYSSDIPTEIEVGTYTIWYKVIGDNNHTDSSPQSIQTEIKAKTSRGGGGGSSSYTVQFETNGGSKVTSQRISRNGVVKEPTAPTKDGYTFAGWYTDKDLTAEYDFTSKVTKSFALYAKWNDVKSDDGAEATPAPTGKPTTAPQATAKPDGTAKSMPFTDVNAGDWFYNNVQYVYENGLMSGVSDTEFAPNENVTRGMFVTILYRMDGEPSTGASTFTDVPSGAYYANAVAWANANGIVEGYSDTEYAPDDAVTREQAAAVLFRYAAYKGESPTGAWAIQLDYTDLTEISDWAAEGVMFCTMKDIMVGRDGGAFDPKANITRAEGAAVFERYLNMTR